MKRWEQLYIELERKTTRLGYDYPMQLPLEQRGGSANSQTYEYRINGKPVLLIAFRDLALKKEEYTKPNRLWAEGLDLILNRYEEIIKRTPSELPRAIAIVIDNIGGSYVIVPINKLIKLYRERIKSSRGTRKFTFVVERRDADYFLVMPPNHPPEPLTNVNNMNSIITFLRDLKKTCSKH